MKTSDSSTTALAILAAEPSGSKEEDRVKGMMNLAVRSNFVHSCKWFIYMQ
jgi:hypothetical protein